MSIWFLNHLWSRHTQQRKVGEKTMAKAIEKRCERCNETVRMLPSSRYCPECRPIVLKELKKKGYFTSVSGVRKYPSKMQKEYEEDIHAGGRFTEYEEKQFKGDWDWNAPQS